MVSLSNLANAWQVGYYDTQEAAQSVALVGDALYVGSDLEGLTVLRLTHLPLVCGRPAQSTVLPWSVL